MRIHLFNNFHRREVTLMEKDGVVRESSYRLALKRLCGMKDCACGGIRGPQMYEIEPIDPNLEAEPARKYRVIHVSERSLEDVRAASLESN